MLERTSFDLSLTDAANHSRLLKDGQELVIIFDWYGETMNTRYFLAVRHGAAFYERILELDLAQARIIVSDGLAVWDFRGKNLRNMVDIVS